MMTISDTDSAGFHLRLPPGLHAAIKDTAEAAGMSMNTWLVRQISALVAATPQPPSGSRRGKAEAYYEATVGFSLSGSEPDDLARKLLDQFESTANLASGTGVSSRVARIELVPKNTPARS